MDKEKFAAFLAFPADKRLELLMGYQLYFWQKLYIHYLNKWWTSWRKANPNQKPYVLWESMYKGRF